MPSAREMTATSVTNGVCKSLRSASLRLAMSLPQHFDVGGETIVYRGFIDARGRRCYKAHNFKADHEPDEACGTASAKRLRRSRSPTHNRPIVLGGSYDCNTSSEMGDSCDIWAGAGWSAGGRLESAHSDRFRAG